MEPTPTTEPTTIAYSKLSSFEMNQIVMKIANTPTTAARAIVIRKIVKAIDTLRTEISEAYKKEIHEVYFQRNEDGTFKKDEGGMDMPIEGKEDEIKKVTEEFGKRTVTVPAKFRPSMLADMKSITGREIEALGELLAEEDGPGLPPNMPNFPQNQNVRSITQ